MNKTKSKVLSLVLASAMIVSSFSSLNFASAASVRETGKLTVDQDELYLASNAKEKDSNDKDIDVIVTVDELLEGVSLKTYDNEEASDVEFLSYTHASGDYLVKSIKDRDDTDNVLTLKKDAKGKEVITVTYEGEYDRNDKTVKVRGKKDITIYADPVGSQIVAEVSDEPFENDKPDDLSSAAINDEQLTFAIYKVTNKDLYAVYTIDEDAVDGKVKKDSDKAFDIKKNEPVKSVNGIYTVKTTYFPEGNVSAIESAQAVLDAANAKLELFKTGAATTTTLEGNVATAKEHGDYKGKALETLKSDVVTKTTTLEDLKKAEPVDDAAIAAAQTALDEAQETLDKYNAQAEVVKKAEDELNAHKEAYAAVKDLKEVDLKKAVTDAEAALAVAKAGGEKKDKLVPEKVASTGTINVDFDLATKKDKTEKTTVKLSVDKKWRAERSKVEINKKGSTTYVTRKADTLNSWDNDDVRKAKDNNEIYNVTGYDIAPYLDKGEVVENTILVTDGKIGAIKGNAKTTVDMDAGSAGNIKANKITIDDGNVGLLEQKGEEPQITVTKGKVKAIDADKAEVAVNGGTISGDVIGKTVDIDANDEDVATTITGNVEAKGDEHEIEINASSDAAVKINGTVKGAVTLNDENVTIGTLDADYDNDITFEDFSGKIGKIINSANVDITVNGDSNVEVKGKLQAGSLEIEDEDGKVTVAEGYFNDISGDGTLAVPAGKLFVEDSMEDITLQLTEGLATGVTAFQSYTDAVDIDDITTLGYTLEKKAVNSDVEKFVVKAVTFAGVQLDKSEVSLAKGQSTTVTAVAYPTGTGMPEGSYVEWSIDGNDDYISMTTEGSVATIKVLDFNKEYATDNQATITATVVDKDGRTNDDFVVATTKVTATALPASTVTLDTTKPVTLGTNAVYQYIAKSSSEAVMTATSSDDQIAKVELFNAADARGYKFQVKGIAEGTATITTTDANGAAATLTVNVVKVNGSLKADTTSYTFAPKGIYDVKFTVTGSNEVPVVSANGKVVSITPRGNGVYRVTAQNPGTAYVVAKAGNTHVSVKFDVAAGAVAKGVAGNNVSLFK
ncbi:hypothetical protein [Clostridium minihomine]|uniref:hypothetical protein n=1 Tax=Clostridium minihomine TaxID=2045012 RepID=UPI000C783260|nr:hypothetical protein [Clostridium minihomine]